MSTRASRKQATGQPIHNSGSSRAEALIESQKTVLERIVAGADLHETLEILTSTLEANADRRTIASVMLASEDQTHLYPAAGKDIPGEWREYIAEVPIAENVGSCGTSAFERHQIVASDIATDPLWAPYRDVALRLGLRACWSTPIISADKSILGTFALYYPEPASPSQAEIEMVEMLARTAAVAIQKANLFRALQKELRSHKESDIAAHRLAAIVESSDDAILSKNLNGIIQSWNAGAQRIFGYTAGEVVGKSITILIPEDRLSEEDTILSNLRAGKRIDHFETIRRHKDGRLLNVSITVSPIRDSTGKVVGASKIARDISGPKQTEVMRNRLAAIVESTDDAIIGLDLDTTITAWNRAAERTFGYSAAEIIGRSVTTLIPPGLEDEEPRILKRLLNGERVEHYETIRQRKDGALVDVSLTVSAIRDETGKIIGASKISRDISELKRQRQALEEETRTLEILNDTGRAIASELDLEKIVQKVTDSATKLTNAKFGAFFYNVTNQEGESYMLFTLCGAPREAFERFGHPRATPLFAPTFKGEPPIRCDDVLKDPRYGQWGPNKGMPAGHLPVRSYLAVPVISRTGDVIGGLFFGHPEVGVFTERSEKLVVGIAAQTSIAMDNARLVADLRTAREQLARHNERLEDQVSKRTAQLRETIQELEAFSYSVSHDMRSPLRAMHGYADALLTDHKDQLDPTAASYLSRIHRAAKRMDLLIQDVLAYSRLAKGEIQLVPVNVETVIQDVIQNYPPLQADRAKITIANPIPPVLGHEAYMTQIVSNILGNAVKFINPGAFPTIVISAAETDGMVRISFRDNGIGMSPDQQKHIFQIFGRVYSEKRFEGTGIGLAIVKKAVERMGGSVGVNSEFGSGSEFFVLLKRA